ncbi:MAG: hypothetical protein U9Q74_12255 [Gemmatimonadota bacterium]|nr:hypothetical protein [Gemmatimonadota bacterium]
MSGRDWDAEMKKIDRAMEKVSDEALFPAKAAKTPEARAAAADTQRKTSTLGVFVRLSLAVALGVAVVFWPYGSRCGLGLAGYLGVVAVLTGAGVWSAVWTWRHRAARGHVLALLIVLWGLILASIEVLPRTGYAVPTAAHPSSWACG